MAIDGDWNLIIKSPMGDQASTLSVKASGGALTGVQTAQGVKTDIVDGAVNGETLTWSASVTTPFPMKLDFTGVVAGDALNGSVKAGSFGTFPFTGARA
jgi:hypothetical protein